MGIKLLHYKQEPYIRVKDGIIIEVCDKFLDLTDFNRYELLNSSIFTVWNKLFRINIKLNFENVLDIEEKEVLFTKQLEVRFVKIKKYENVDSGETFYTIVEKENSRLNDKLTFVDKLISDDKIGIGIFTAPDLMLVKANGTYLKYLPKPFNLKELVYGKCLKQIIPDFEGSRGEKAWIDIINTNESVYVREKQGLMLGNEERYWNNTITPVSENGEVKYIISMLEDVTEHVLGREHIRVKNEKLEAIIDNLNDGVAVIDRNGAFIRTNKAIKEFMNTKLDLGLAINRVTETIKSGKKYCRENGEEIEIYNIPLFRVLKGERVKQEQIILRNGSEKKYFDFDGIPIYDKNGELELGIIIVKNMTEQIEINNEIERQNKKLQAIIECMDNVVTIVDKDGNYLGRSDMLNSYFGISDENFYNIISKVKFYDLNGEVLPVEELCTARLLKGQKVKNHISKILRGEEELFVSASGIPIFDENGDLEMGVMVTHDITYIINKEKEIKLQQDMRLKAEEDKLQALEKALKMKDEFISLISHEFKTPLNVIYAALQLIDYVYINQVPEKVQKLLVNIKQNTFRQLRLVNNLLDITRLNSEPFKLCIKNINIVNLVRLITKSVKLYSDQKNIKLEFLCKLESKHIAVDDEKLERIILNLLSNAIKFTNNGGIITVCLKESHKRDEIIIEVSDTGIGIPKNKQDIIFERFGQVESDLSRQAEGTGIGLSLVKHLVDILGGKIQLESELGNGSTFRIFLPANECIENEEYEACLDVDSRLVNATRVEFSDIYV